MTAARRLAPAPPLDLATAPANDGPRAVAPELRPFIVAMARLLVADLAKRPPAGEGSL